jgi:hypothetical protein
MARHIIIDKLSRELQEIINSERQVVYLLIELRKLIEINQDGANYKTLKFCCDWVAHPVLKGREAQNIVRQFDEFQKFNEIMFESAHSKSLTMDTRFFGKLEELLRLNKFRHELGEYLKLQGLDSSIAGDEDKWTTFLKYYAGVIEDCPLKCISEGLVYVDEVVLKVIKVKPELVGHQLVIQWSWISKITGKSMVNQQFY